jgi:hypothetical protein
MKRAINARMIGSNSCSAFGVIISASDPIRALCRKLVQQGWDPQASMKVWKGERPFRLIHAISNPDHHTNLKGGSNAQ